MSNPFRVIIVAGARPNFVKIAPLAHAFQRRDVAPVIVHTGQHYSPDMSRSFFDQLNIPAPDVNLEVGSGSQIWQIAETMRRIEPVIEQQRPHVVVVVGDVNSTVAATIASVKLGVPVAHVEAGLRSFDRDMPEEVNRVLTDSISQWLFTSEPSGEKNLLREGIAAEKVHFVGNVMIDTLREHLAMAREKCHYAELGMERGGYAVMTAHRPSNVDVSEHLESILDAAATISERLPILFVIHPRTRSRIDDFGLAERIDVPGIHTVSPLGYLEMLSLLEASRLVLTDSGGIQEECTALEVPCLTLRENTERPVTIDVGANALVGWRRDEILAAGRRLLDGDAPPPRLPEKWDGRAAERIVDILLTDLSASS